MKFCMRLFFSICVLASVSFVCAQTSETKKVKRADVPWVSLAHQRELAKKTDNETNKQKVSGGIKKPQVKKLAQNAQAPELTADKFSYATGDTSVLVATGNARIGSSEFDVSAEKIVYMRSFNAARVMDDVRISVDTNRIVTEAADITLDGKYVKSTNSRFGTYPLYVSAEVATGDTKTYTLEKSNVYFGEPSLGSFNAEAAKTTYDKESRVIKMEDVWFKIDQIPLVHLSEVEITPDNNLPFEVVNRLSYNSDYGLSLRNTVHYLGYENFAPGALFDIYTARSVLAGPAFKYDVSAPDNKMKGFLQSGFIYDTGSREDIGENFFGTPIDRDRYFVEFRHNQIFKDRFGLTAVVSTWSDEFVTRDFRSNFFRNNQTPDNFVEGIYYGDMWTTSAFTRFAPNNWELVQQRLPEVRFDLQPLEIPNTGAYVRAFASAVYLHQYNPYPNEYFFAPAESIVSKRVDGYVGIDRPIELSSWAKITPVAGVRSTSYFDTANGSSDYTRALGQVGFDAQADAWGQFDVQSKAMGIDGLRHHIMPVISYRYIPEAETGKNKIRAIDYDYFTTYPPILDLGSMRNIDDMSEVNTLRFGIKNVFETRDNEFGSRELGRFDVFQDINFKRRQPALRYKYWDDDHEYKQDYSELYVNASVSPARWLTVGAYTRVSVEHSTIPEIHPYIKLMESDVASLSFGAVYLKDTQTLKQYYAALEYRFSERYQTYAGWHYDAELNEFIYQEYGLRTKLGNTWLLEYYLSHRTGSTRGNSTSVGVNVIVLGM